MAGSASDYGGTTIEVPAGAVQSGTTFYLSQVVSGGPYVSDDEVRGGVISMKALGPSGEDAPFSSGITVTIPYNALIVQGEENPEGLIVTHYDEETGEFEPLETDYGDGYLTFLTSEFSLFAVVKPTELGFDIVGGDESKDYRMIAFSGRALDKNVRSNLEMVFGTYNEALWRLFAYDPLAGEYVEVRDENIWRFDDEFGLSPGHGFWLISRYNQNISVKGLSYDNNVGSVFYSILYPGWNMFSHPWTLSVNLGNYDIEVSVDGQSWVGFDDNDNNLTGNFWRFKEATASPGDWYEPLTDISLAKGKSYWLRNFMDQPVYIRIKKQSMGRLRVPGLPGQIKALAMKWFNRVLSVASRAVFAAPSNSVQPPPPPGAAAANDQSANQQGNTDSSAQLPGSTSTTSTSSPAPAPPSGGGAAGGGGFVTTVADGPGVHPVAETLSNFRDTYLQPNEGGKLKILQVMKIFVLLTLFLAAAWGIVKKQWHLYLPK